MLTNEKESYFTQLRLAMVENQIASRGIKDESVLEAFRKIPRHLFIPPKNQEYAYNDNPLSIGENQTISQPYIVALMTQMLEVKAKDKILEIGTGSGYQLAILNFLGAQVFSVERIPLLAKKAKDILQGLGYKATILEGDGSLGWQEHAPYNKIIVTAAAPFVSKYWLEQLIEGGRIVLPLGSGSYQDLTVIDKDNQGKISQKTICGCVFVPLIGECGHSL